ncbi:hypothetical protein C6361_01840 [Plantactinospora sp. BC1]|nr:hypothetical protein C6361_01840 [Plantactinospora sp. BC1]
MGQSVQFRILGPLEVAVGGRQIAVPLGRQQITMAMLLLHPGQVTPADRIAEAVWEDRMPATPANQIAICIHALRRKFSAAGADEKIITTRAPGYLLRPAPGSIDTHVVEEHAAAARKALADGAVEVAAERLRAALAVWRGRCLAGITSRVLQPEIIKWEERRLALTEEYFQAELQLGHHVDIISQLQAFVAEHPLREKARVRLMVALYRAGRQADALNAFHDARRVLKDELGLDPGAALQATHRAILRGELSPPAGGPGPEMADEAPEPARSASAAGRTGGVRGPAAGTGAGAATHRVPTADEHADDLPAGGGEPVRRPAPAAPDLAPGGGPEALPGGVEPGRLLGPVAIPDVRPGSAEPVRPETARAGRHPDIRPRMLPADIADLTGRHGEAEELERALTPDDRAVLPIALVAGRGGVGKTTIAIHVAHRLSPVFPDGQLYVDLRGAHQPAADPLEVITRFLRELGADTSTIPDGLEARAALYRSLLADRRVLLVLDNAADERQIEPLLPGSPGCAVLITSRYRLTCLAGVRLVDLAALESDQAIQLLTWIVGASRVEVEPRAAEDLARFCGGLPLAVRVIGARLAAKPHWSLAQMVTRLADESRRLDELAHGSLEVRASLALSYQALEPAARLLFRRLALLDVVDFAAWVAAPLLESSMQEAEDLLERLVDARLVDVFCRDATGNLRYGFHDLVRLYARERVEEAESAEERTAAVGRVCSALLHLTEQAHRRVYGGDYVVVHGPAPRWRLDERTVQRLTEAPLAWYDAERRTIVSAVRQTAAAGMSALCWDLAGTALSMFGVRSHYDEWRETHEVSLFAARAANDRCGEAVLLTGLGDLYVVQQRYEQAAERLGGALEIFDEIGNWHGYGLALRKVAYIDSVYGRTDEALRRYETACRLLREAGDRGAQAHVLRWTSQIYLERGQPERARPYMEEALAVAEGSNGRARAQSLYLFGELHLATGDLETADKTFDEVLALVHQIGDPRGQAHALYGKGRVSLKLGFHRIADSTFRQALAIAREVPDRLVEVQTLIALGELHTMKGETTRAIGLLTDAVRAAQEIHSLVWLARGLTALAEVHFSAGAESLAEQCLAEAARLRAEFGVTRARTGPPAGRAPLRMVVAGRSAGNVS